MVARVIAGAEFPQAIIGDTLVIYPNIGMANAREQKFL
jgi:hypothetical protein